MKIIISTKAKRDLYEINYYFKSIGLQKIVKDFLYSFKNIQIRLSSHPEIGSQRFCKILNDSSIRYFVLKKFDYYIFYKIEKSQLKIIRILSSKRDIFSIL